MNTITNQNTLNFEESAEAARVTFPLTGLPFAQMMDAIYEEQGFVRIVR